MNAGSFWGRMSAGFLTPFVGVPDLTILSTVACAALLVGMIWPSSVASFVVLGFLYGAFSGMSMFLFSSLVCWLDKRTQILQ